MKGYSFQELVNLAEAAVKRAGDTMTGNLTAPAVLVSSAQNTSVNALTRKDYVDTRLAQKLDLTGGTLTGPLTVPKVLVSAAQSDEGNALVRKDYVDIALASKLGNTGVQTINGELILNAPAPILTLSETDTGKKWLLVADNLGTRFQMDSTVGTEGWSVSGSGSMYLRDPHTMTVQGTSASSLTRKDYVDTALSGKFDKAGGTITGQITSLAADNFRIAHGGIGTFWRNDGAALYLMLTADGDPLGYWNNLRPFRVNLTSGTVENETGVLLHGPQRAEPAAATRKDYVDGQVATRAPATHTHTVSAITDLRPQDTNATANTLALRDGAADVHARLLRTTFGDESRMYGAIAFRINNSDDNYTRYCSDPAAVRNWMRGAKTDWQMGWRAYIEDPNTPMTEYHIPGRAAVVTYITSDGAYRIASSNGAGGATNDRLVIDTAGSLYTSGVVFENGQRVYSPNNPPHYSHNHTAAQGNSDIVAGGYGQIGTYGFFYNLGTAASVGTQRDGSTLRWNGARDKSTANINPSGTWKCLGHANPNGSSEGEACTLWVRIA